MLYASPRRDTEKNRTPADTVRAGPADGSTPSDDVKLRPASGADPAVGDGER
jgi:hypothetical protein